MNGMTLSIGAMSSDLLEGQVRSFIGWLGECYRNSRKSLRPDWRYFSAEELIAHEGRAWHANMWLMDVPDMTPKDCFNNCFLLSQERPELTYCEGFALMEFGIPCHHAWLIDADGRVQDPTWKPLYRTQRDRDAARGSRQPYNGRAAYLGVTVPHDPHITWTLRTGYPNILSINDDDIDVVMRLGVAAALESPEWRAIMEGSDHAVPSGPRRHRRRPGRSAGNAS